MYYEISQDFCFDFQAPFWMVLPEPERRCWAKPRPARPTFLSFPYPVLSSWKCLLVWVPPGSEICLLLREKIRLASFLLTKLTPLDAKGGVAHQEEVGFTIFFSYVTCSWQQKTKLRIYKFTNLKCCIKTREPFKTPFNCVLLFFYHFKNILCLVLFILKALKDTLQHIKFVNWWNG